MLCVVHLFCTEVMFISETILSSNCPSLHLFALQHLHLQLLVDAPVDGALSCDAA